MLRKKLLAFALSTALVLTAVPVYADNDPATGSANAASTVSPNTTAVTQESGNPDGDDPSGDSDKKDEDNNGGEGGNTTVSPDSTVSPDKAEEDKKDTVSDPSAGEGNDDKNKVSENSASENNAPVNPFTSDDSGIEEQSTGYVEPDIEITDNTRSRRLLMSSVNGSTNSAELKGNYISDHTSVKAQGNTNTCWVFASMAAAESALLKKGKSSDINLSEKFNSYYTWNPVSGFLDGDAENDNKKINSGNYLNLGGSAVLIGGTLAAWKGLTEEKGNLAWSTAVPDATTEAGRAVTDTVPANKVSENSPYHVQDVKINKLTDSDESRNKIKQMIKDYGAVTMALRSFGGQNSTAATEFATGYSPWSYYGGGEGGKIVSLYNYGDFSSKSKKTDHEVCVVGWDDDFDSYSDKVKNQPGYRKGAWLVKNSWGTANMYRDDGLMAVSYYDTSVLADTVGIAAYDVAVPGDGNYYNNNYQINSQDMANFASDKLHSWVRYYENAGSNFNYGILYQAAASSAEKLKAVQIYTKQTSNNVNIRIYKNPELSSGSYTEKDSDLIYNYNHSFSDGAGYRTIALSDSGIVSGKDLKLSRGDKFLVVVSNNTSADVYYYSDVVDSLDNYQEEGVELTFTNAHSGKSFKGDGTQGAATLGTISDGDFYLKVFTNNVEATTYDLSDTTKTTVTGIADSYEYTGKQIKPDKITVKYNGVTLTKGTDYAVSYTGDCEGPNTTAYVIIEGIGAYTGKITVPYTIGLKIDLNSDKTTVTGVEESYKYTGQSYESKILSGISVKYNGTTLTKDKDYELSTAGSFKDPDSVSYIYVTGIGLYTGTKSVPVLIRSKDTFDVSAIPDVKYTGFRHELKGSGTSSGVSYDLELTVKNGDQVLSRGSDYNVKYNNNTVAASSGASKPPYVVVTGTGIYSGFQVTRKFNIVADTSLFSALDTNLEHTYYHNSGAKINLNPRVTIKQKDAYGAEKTVTLKNNTDYTIAYQRYDSGWSSATTTVNSDGHWRAVITGKGNYAGCSYTDDDANATAYSGKGHFQVVSNSSPKASQLNVSVKLKQGMKTPEIKTKGATVNIDSYYTITVKQKQNGKQVQLAEGTGYKYYLCKADKTPEGDLNTKSTGDAGDHYIRIVPGTSNLFSGSKDVKIKINGLNMPTSLFTMSAGGYTYTNNGQIPYDGKETTASIYLDGTSVGEMTVGAYAGTYQKVYQGTGVYGGRKVTLKLKRKAMPLNDAYISYTAGTTLCNAAGAYPTITVTIPGESSSQTLNLATQSSYGGIQFKVGNNKKSGYGTITARAVGNSRFTGSKRLADFYIAANNSPEVIAMKDVSANAIDNANKIVFMVEDVSNANSKPAVRAIQYSADGQTFVTLSNGRDYQFDYLASASTKKGTVTIKSGTGGNYTFNGLTFSYGVYTSKKNIDKVNGQSKIPDVSYSSSPYPLIRPEITSVTVGGSTYGSSCFDVEYSNNYKKGTGKATIYLHSEMTGGVSGKKTFSYKIK